LLASMIAALTMAAQMRPTKKVADDRPKVDLEVMVPKGFGEWHVINHDAVVIANPQQQEVLNRIYSQTLSRTYVNLQGYRVMLSVAYGDNQHDAVQLHRPEVCYPAQGFQLASNNKGVLRVSFGTIPVRRLETSLGQQRMEPITYWTMIGSSVTLGGFDKKIAEIGYGIRGEIPDGLLFRISSIDQSTPNAYRLHQQFVEDLLGAVTSDVRKTLSGL
jgi:EpsI family protein